MDAFIDLPPLDRQRACEVAGEQLAINAFSIEKDFWVCWTLRELFSLPGIGEHLTFKGGTSLSKGWKLIQRFSEDIDVVIHRDALGFDGERSPEAASGSNERRRRLEALRTACQVHIRDALAPALEARLHKRLDGRGAWSLIDHVGDPDGQTLIFKYPAAIAEGGYLRAEVKIELGARSDVDPSAHPQIQPYLAEVMPDVTGPSAFSVQTLDPRRTFLEKASLLHEETYRANGKAPAARLSRHYYDLWCLIQSGTGDQAAADSALFNRVAVHREVFFRRSAEAQATLRPGTLRLRPAADREPDWRRDYELMRESMFFGNPPEWGEIMRVVSDFEARINTS